jgi:hypothetical protein
LEKEALNAVKATGPTKQVILLADLHRQKEEDDPSPVKKSSRRGRSKEI